MHESRLYVDRNKYPPVKNSLEVRTVQLLPPPASHQQPLADPNCIELYLAFMFQLFHRRHQLLKKMSQVHVRQELLHGSLSSLDRYIVVNHARLVLPVSLPSSSFLQDPGSLPQFLVLQLLNQYLSIFLMNLVFRTCPELLLLLDI